MHQNGDGETAAKIDVILHGVETIGSAQRSTDKEEMRRQFMTISEGAYANTLSLNLLANAFLKNLMISLILISSLVLVVVLV